MTGRNCAVATTPSQNGSPVSVKHQPALGDLLHPGADERHRLAEEEQPVVAVAEGLAGLAPSEPSWGEDRHTGHDRASRSGWGVGPPSISARWASRWTRRSRAASIMDRRRSGLGFEGRDLAVDAGAGVLEDRPPLGRVLRGAEAFAVALARRLVLEQLADLGEREPGLVAELLDVPQPVEVRVVVQPVGTTGASGRLQQTDLLVVADRAGRQTGLGGDLLDLEQRGVCGGRGRRWFRGHRAQSITTLTFTLRSGWAIRERFHPTTRQYTPDATRPAVRIRGRRGARPRGASAEGRS